MTNPTERYRVCWRSTVTGTTGHGDYVFDRAGAESMVRAMDREYPELSHRWEAHPGEGGGSLTLVD